MIVADGIDCRQQMGGGIKICTVRTQDMQPEHCFYVQFDRVWEIIEWRMVTEMFTVQMCSSFAA
jgi:hypothetical protein